MDRFGTWNFKETRGIVRLEIFGKLEELRNWRNWHDGSFKELILFSLKLIGLEFKISKQRVEL